MIGNAANRQFDLVHAVQPELKAIVDVTLDVALLMVRVGQGAVCMAREEGSYPLKPSSLQVGSRRPLGVGAGSLAILAAMDDDAIDSILTQNEDALQGYPSYSIEKILEMVTDARRSGFAYVDGLIIPEMIAVAAPILDPKGSPIASITCSAINSRLRGARLDDACRMVVDSAARLSASPLTLKTAPNSFPETT
ncbi:DNA-binding transcriptional repressor AllR [Oceanibacterium hippocampi]|uniref:DNA-binding transcriptional repressor AllR n=2 Tax=Oceanibacterium hippocampi TaxID=745714 RepID=A0A1Y5TPR4_9PROT|nr:DNA-binding transcriptional repressor AllR [Oceanibacterium hippocampi]